MLKLPKELLKMVNHLNEDELHVLHHVIAQRIRFFQTARAMYAMKNFNILDRVSFSHNGRYIEGTITRLNQKTITVTLDDGNHWNVSPGLLVKVKEGVLTEIKP